MFQREGKNWVKKKQTVNYVEETVDSDDDSEGDFAYNCDRVLDVNKWDPTRHPQQSRFSPPMTPTTGPKCPGRPIQVSEKPYYLRSIIGRFGAATPI